MDLISVVMRSSDCSSVDSEREETDQLSAKQKRECADLMTQH